MNYQKRKETINIRCGGGPILPIQLSPDSSWPPRAAAYEYLNKNTKLTLSEHVTANAGFIAHTNIRLCFRKQVYNSNPQLRRLKFIYSYNIYLEHPTNPIGKYSTRECEEHVLIITGSYPIYTFPESIQDIQNI